MTDLIHNWVNQHRRLQNYFAASKQLSLTPQEQYAYRHHLSNLDRGGVPHPDGSLSSFLNLTVGFGDRTYVIPSVWDNKILDQEAAINRARQDGIEKWPSYPSEDAATARYNAIHGYMERDTDRKLNAGTNPADRRPDLPGVEGAQPAVPTQQHR